MVAAATMVEIKELDMMSVAKMYAGTMAVLGAIWGILAMVVGLIGGLAGLAMGILALIAGVIGGAIAGFVAGAVCVLIYNFVAAKMGGIKFKA